MHFPKFFVKSVLLASILGAVLPIFFYLLFSWNTSATGRDILPPLDNPLEIIGFIGMLIFALPVFVIFGLVGSLVRTVHAHGLEIPFYDSLPSNLQSNVFLTISFIINILLWTVLFLSLAHEKKVSK